MGRQMGLFGQSRVWRAIILACGLIWLGPASGLKADTLIYSIYFSDSGFYGGILGGENGRKVLSRMSKETGGGFFEVSKKQSLDSIFAAIVEELRSQYSIGYYPTHPVKDGRWHNVRIRMKNPDYVARGRKEYLDARGPQDR